MGGHAHLIVVAADPDMAVAGLDLAEARLHELEARWSRFRPDSELSRLNAAPGRPLWVSADTRTLVAACTAAWHSSEGRFDPTVLDALERLGYDRCFTSILSRAGRPRPASASPPGPSPAAGCAAITVDDAAGTVTLPPSVRLDPGGLGKGLAADLISSEVLARGVLGACINVCGDLQVRGQGPDLGHPGWQVAVEHPVRAGQAWAHLQLPPSGAAVASSSILLTRWDDDRHHLLDPRSGLPTGGEIVAATVVAADGAWADAATKIAFVAGDDARASLERLDLAALLLLRDGRTLTTPALAALAPGGVISP
jgi:thiamine biosynthesis lipoprotein